MRGFVGGLAATAGFAFSVAIVLALKGSSHVPLMNAVLCAEAVAYILLYRLAGGPSPFVAAGLALLGFVVGWLWSCVFGHQGLPGVDFEAIAWTPFALLMDAGLALMTLVVGGWIDVTIRARWGRRV